MKTAATQLVCDHTWSIVNPGEPGRCQKCGLMANEKTAATQESPINTNGNRVTEHLSSQSECHSAGEGSRNPAPAAAPNAKQDKPSDTPRTDAIIGAYLAKCDTVNPDGSTHEDIERDLCEPIAALERALAHYEQPDTNGIFPPDYITPTNKTTTELGSVRDNVTVAMEIRVLCGRAADEMTGLLHALLHARRQPR